MPNTTELEIATALGSLKRSSPRIASAVLASPEGRGVADPDLQFQGKLLLTGMAAASMAIMRKSFNDNHLGSLRHVQVTGDSGTILLIPVGPKAVLCTVVTGTGSLEPVLDAVRSMAGKLDSLL